MEQEILDALKTRFPGVDERTLRRIAAKAAKTAKADDDATTIAEGVTFQQVLDNHGDYRATEATKTAVTNYEKAHGLKNGKPAQGGGQETETEPKDDELPADTPAWAKAIIAQNKALSDKVVALEAGKVTSGRKAKVEALLASTTDKFKAREIKNFDRLAFKDDEEFDAYLSELEADAKDNVAEAAAEGATFGRPPVGGNQNGKDDVVPKHLAEHFENGGKKDGQPF